MEMTLRAARINKGLNLDDAAVLIGINKFTLRNYERCKSFPNVPVIKEIEKVYGIPFADIDFFCNASALKGRGGKNK